MKKLAYGLLALLIVVLLIEHLYMSAVFNMAFRDMTTSVGDEQSYVPDDPRLEKLSDSPQALNKAMKEIRELEAMPAMSPQAAEVRNYLDWLLDLPWSQHDEAVIDLKKARQVLDKEHFGLEKVKDHIIEYLAVQKRVPNGKAPILCFVGPPGVGKTTLAKSIAEATGRKFVRVSLGGVRDEAAIRGFLRTYTSSKPGKIVQAMKEVGTNNPVMLLDEIDKMTSDVHGDPSAALLEVLDPAQNNKFQDHYLETPYDLSHVMFIATANNIGEIPGPLLDRMEVIELSSYTLQEKMAIAKDHLLPKQMKENGLSKLEFSITDEAIEQLITNYTMESGVRQLDRIIGNVARKVVTNITEDKVKSVNFTPDMIEPYLGPSQMAELKPVSKDTVGITNGLAWTPVGGRLLPIEAIVIPGEGKVIQTGNLGQVQQESITAAMTVVKTLMTSYGLKADMLKDKDIHIHAPEAAIKKDGPSAGVTIVTSIISALTNKPVRKDVAMTGEITLNGRVLPIGGLKEKLLAAHRAGMKTVLIPKDNAPHLEEVPEKVKAELEIIPVDNIREVLKHALGTSTPQQQDQVSS